MAVVAAFRYKLSTQVDHGVATGDATKEGEVHGRNPGQAGKAALLLRELR